VSRCKPQLHRDTLRQSVDRVLANAFTAANSGTGWRVALAGTGLKHTAPANAYLDLTELSRNASNSSAPALIVSRRPASAE